MTNVIHDPHRNLEIIGKFPEDNHAYFSNEAMTAFTILVFIMFILTNAIVYLFVV